MKYAGTRNVRIENLVLALTGALIAVVVSSTDVRAVPQPPTLTPDISAQR